MITGFVGPRGSGKTLYMSVRLRRRYLKGAKLLTNYGVAMPHEGINAERLVEMGTDLQNCAMGIDEIHVLLDSRGAMTKRNKLLTYFILQTRKRNVALFFTTQDEGQVDIRLRRNVDYWVYCKRVGTHTFRYRIFEGLTGKPRGTLILDGRKYYGLYDTTETIRDFASSD